MTSFVVTDKMSNVFMAKLDEIKRELTDKLTEALERAEAAETEISSLLAVIDKAVDCYFNDKGDIKDAMYALRRKVEPK